MQVWPRGAQRRPQGRTAQPEPASRRGAALARSGLSLGERSREEWGRAGVGTVAKGRWSPTLTPRFGVCACLSGSSEELALHLAGMNNASKEHCVASVPETMSGQEPRHDQQPGLACGPAARGTRAWLSRSG